MEINIAKKDYLIVSLIGLFFGLFLLPVLSNLEIPRIEVDFTVSIFVILGFAVFSNIALWIASIAGKYLPWVFQFAKFGAVGALNTMIDLGILNGLIYISQIDAGLGYAFFKAISFIGAGINSYLFNHYWVFESKREAGAREFGQFMIVSLVGFLINVGVASFLVNFVPYGGISSKEWATVSALIAVAFLMIWNFIGYKFIVFKKEDSVAFDKPRS